MGSWFLQMVPELIVSLQRCCKSENIGSHARWGRQKKTSATQHGNAICYTSENPTEEVRRGVAKTKNMNATLHESDIFFWASSAQEQEKQIIRHLTDETIDFRKQKWRAPKATASGKKKSDAKIKYILCENCAENMWLLRICKPRVHCGAHYQARLRNKAKWAVQKCGNPMDFPGVFCTIENQHDSVLKKHQKPSSPAGRIGCGGQLGGLPCTQMSVWHYKYRVFLFSDKDFQKPL